MKKSDIRKIIDRISLFMVVVTLFSLYAYISIDKRSDRKRDEFYSTAVDSLVSEIDRKDSMMLSYDRRLTNIHELNWDNIDFWLKFFNIQNAEIVKKQIYLETGNLTSSICINNHNLFGMKFPGKRGRTTTASGIKNGHSYYDNYIASIHDYALWQQSRKRIENEDYFAFLNRIGYAEDKKYIVLLKMIPDSAVH